MLSNINKCMHLLYGYGLVQGYLHVVMHHFGVIIVSTCNVLQGHLKIKHTIILLSVKNICVSGAQKQSYSMVIYSNNQQYIDGSNDRFLCMQKIIRY